MSPEEREKFRAGMHARCGHHGASSSAVEEGGPKA
jgi:hypothetical protein